MFENETGFMLIGQRLKSMHYGFRNYFAFILQEGVALLASLSPTWPSSIRFTNLVAFPLPMVYACQSVYLYTSPSDLVIGMRTRHEVDNTREKSWFNVV